MNLIIFGGAGFIGRRLKEYLAGLSNESFQIHDLDIVGDSSVGSFCDVRSEITMDIGEASSSIIFNLAAIHKTPGHPDNDYFETNIRGAENICNFARRRDIRTIVFTSSIAPYGASEELRTEESLATPNTPYGISKLVAEHIHREWQAEDKENRKLIIVRPGVVFGRGEGGNFSRLYQALAKGFFFYPGRKDTLKAAVYVKDVCRILYETAIYEPVGVSMFNLTYDPPDSIERICETISEVTGTNRPRWVVPGVILRTAARSVALAGGTSAQFLSGIHPDRVKKLLISTNISGAKLSQSRYKLQYTLFEAVTDWYDECEKKGLL